MSKDETKKTAGRLPETTLYRKLTTPKNKMNFLIDNANQFENNRQNNNGKELITKTDNEADKKIHYELRLRNNYWQKNFRHS